MTAAIHIMLGLTAWMLIGIPVAIFLGRAIHQADESDRQRDPEWLARAIEIGGASDFKFINHDRGDSRG